MVRSLAEYMIECENLVKIYKTEDIEVLAGDAVDAVVATLEGDEKDLFERLLTALDDVDDVQNVYHNVENL